MPNIETARCRFHLTSSGERDHPLLQIEFLDKGLPALESPLKRVFFTFSDDTTWDDAGALVAELNQKVRNVSVTVYAAGEA